MKTPAISVVLPTYNSEKYIEEALESILVQTLDDFELLIVNEHGSDDRTVSIINHFTDPRIRIVQNSQRLGLAESLNEGIRQSRGRYIARMDADDVSLPERFEKQFTFMERNSDIAICGTWVELFGNTTGFLRHRTEPDWIRTCMLMTSEIRHPTVMLRADSIRRHGLWYNPAYLVEDFELFSRAVHSVRIANVPEVLLKYRIAEENTSQVSGEAFIEGVRDVVVRNLEEFGVAVSPAQRRLLDSYRSFLETKDDLNQLIDLFGKITSRNEEKRKYLPEILNYVLERHYVSLLNPLHKKEFSDEIITEITSVAVEMSQKSEVALFGLGKAFTDLVPYFIDRLGSRISCVSDNDPGKWGKVFNGLECVPPEKLPRDAGILVIANYDNMADIVRDLADKGFENVRPYVEPLMIKSKGDVS